MTVRRWAAACVLVALVPACSGSSPTETARPSRRTSPPATNATTSTSTSTSITSTSTTTSTVPAAARIAAAGLQRGAKGDAVLTLEQRLIDLHFDPGKVDGVYDASTYHAVLGFQKTYGLPRTGRATADVLDRLTTAQLPEPLVPDGGAHRVEVDLKRQVLFLYEGGRLFRTVGVSTGSGQRYCVEGECARAVTPGGSFKVSRRIAGWRTSRLGKLYNPLYFNGGIAIHGAPSVPAYPASHGCVRVPMYISMWLPSHVPNGTPVYVVGGARAPVPFNEPAPGDPPPTTTTAPPASSAPSTSSTSSTPSTSSTSRPSTSRPSTTTSSPAGTSTTTTTLSSRTTAPPATTTTRVR